MAGFDEELRIALEAVRDVGLRVMEIYETDYDIETKNDNSPLTKADRLSHEMLVSRLSSFTYNIISEEADDVLGKDKSDGNTGTQWVIDPLDGTSDFIQKTGEFSIMVALLKEGRPVLGVVYAPAVDKLWYGVEGKGAFAVESGVERKIFVSPIKDLEDYRLVISRNHFRQKDKDVADSLGITEFKKMGSVGIKFCRIAEGLAELCVYTTGKMGVWDDCASHIILKEAGGDVFDVNGCEPIYDLKSRKMENGFIGTNGKNRERIIESIRKSLD